MKMTMTGTRYAQLIQIDSELKLSPLSQPSLTCKNLNLMLVVNCFMKPVRDLTTNFYLFFDRSVTYSFSVYKFNALA